MPEKHVITMNRRSGWLSRLLGLTVITAMVLPAPAQAWAQSQGSKRAYEARVRQWFDSLAPSAVEPAPAAPAYSYSPPQRVAATSAEILPVPLSPKRVELIAGHGSDLDPWQLFDGNATTALGLTSSEPVSFAVDLQEERALSAITVLGPTEGTLSVFARGNTGLSPIPSLQSVRIQAKANEWQRVSIDDSTKRSRLVIKWTPVSLAAPAEIGLWGRWLPLRDATDAQLADRILANAAPGSLVANARPERVTAARVALGASGPQEGVVHVDLSADPRSWSHAFLVYELTGLGHFTEVVRQINGLTPRGGELLARNAADKSEGGLQVEEISPEWLKVGRNEIRFLPLPQAGAPEYSVQRVRIVGTGHSSLYEARMVDARPGNAGSVQRFAFNGSSQAHDVVFELLQPTAGHLSVRASGPSAGPATRIDLGGLEPGWHRASLDSLPKAASGIEVALDKAAGGGQTRVEGQSPAVSEVVVTASPVASGAGEHGIAISYPLHGECRNHEARITGFVTRLDGEDVVGLRANGRDVTPALALDRSFALKLSQPPQTRNKPWSADIEATLSNGKSLRRKVSLAPCVDDAAVANHATTEDEGAPYAALVRAGEKKTLAFAGAKLEIPAGAVDHDVRITIRPLVAGQVHETGPRISNASPEGRGFRFGPHGLKFKKPVKLTLPYDAAALKQGQTERDLFAFYYDEPLGSWQRIGRYDTAHAGALTSLSEHFTDFVTGALAMPDEPGVKSFSANEMKNVKVGDPGAGVEFIAPPVPNASGTMNLKYPIEVPPGRNGVEPRLAFTYSSDKTNGWLGVGWDLHLSAIEIDTRFGVPWYDEVNHARDSYILDGEEIVPNPPGSNTYVRRVEGAFDTIVRNVDSSNCVTSWTVTDKHGTVSTFGGAGAVLAQPGTPCNVFRWGLSSVQDTFGNRMTLTYVTDSSGSGDPYVELYPAQIDYTSHVGTGLSASYRVLFVQDSGTARPDVIISGRPGFQERTRYRLDHVDVQLLNGTATPTTIRRYQLAYEQPSLQHFYKSLLTSIGQQGLGAAVQLDQHTFQYGGAETVANVHGNQTGVRGFGVQGPWGNAQSSSALSRVDDEMGGGGITLGVGFPIISFSVNGGGNAGSESTQLSLLDLNGDGLPDFGANGTSYMNYLRPAAGSPHLQSQTVSGLDSLGRTNKSGWSVGGGVSVVGIGPNASYTRTTTEDKEVVIDIDGDGLVDRAWVANDQLKWARNDGNNHFVAMASSGTVLQNTREVNQDFVSAGAQGGGLVRINPVVRWNAPFGQNQAVTIQGAIQKLNAGGNGVDIAIYRNSTLLWSNSVGAADLSSCVPSGSAASNNTGCGSGLHATVSAGDSLYFLTSPHHDPTGPASQFGLESIDNQVSWSPQVSYDTRPTPNDIAEPYGMPVHVFSQGDDFRLLRPEVQWVASADGFIHVASNRSWLGETAAPKGSTSDEVTLKVIRHPKTSPTTSDVKFQQTYQANAGTAIAFDSSFKVDAGDSVTLEVRAGTTIDFDQLHLAPSITYTNYCRRVSTSDVPYCADVHYVAGPPLLGALDNDPEADSPVSIDLLTQRVQVSYPFANYFGETQARTVAAASSTTANGTISFFTPQAATGVVLIQGVNRLYHKQSISSFDDGMGGPGSGSLPLNNVPLTDVAAGQLSVTVYGPPNSSASGTVTVGGVSIPVTSKALDPDFDRQDPDGLPVDPMSGGYHRWASGFMNGDLAGGFNPANIVFPLDATAHARHTPTWFFFGVPQHEDDPDPSHPTNPHLLETWQGPGGTFIRAGEFNASRGSANFAGSGGLGSLRHAETWNFDFTVSAAVLGVGVNQGRTKNDHEFFDFNGDRFPDAISADGTVQFGDGAGGFNWTQKVANVDSLPALRRVDHGTLHASASLGDVKLITDTATDGTVRKSITAGFAFGTDYGLSTTNVDWLDVNGDGLPDAVERNDDNVAKDDDHAFSVRLNYGYRLGPAISWPAHAWSTGSTESATGVIGALAAKTIGVDHIDGLINDLSVAGTSVGINGVRTQDTSSNNVNVGLAGGTGGFEVSGGAGFSFGVSRTLVDMVDVNGDGLPDQVIRVHGEDVNGDSNSLVLRVRLNLGNGFASEDTFFTAPKWAGVESSNPFEFAGDINDSLGFRRSKSFNQSFSFKICFFVCVGASGFHESGSAWAHSNFEDLDGDGRPDMVFKSKDNTTVYGKLNVLPKELNLLTKVNRPLGGSFQVEYSRAGNLVAKTLPIPKDAPSNKYVMTRLDVSDGQTPVANHYIKTFDYDTAGFHDRLEREDYGFAKVTTSRLNTDGTLYSKVEVTYNNQDFYRKNLVAQSIVRDAQDKLFDVQKYTYASSGWGTCASPTSVRTAFPAELTRTTGYFEGSGTDPNATAPVSTSQTRAWDCVGNLTDMFDSGDANANNDIKYHIDYNDPNLVPKKIYRANKVTATDHFNKVLRDRRATYDARGALLTFNKVVIGGVDPITGLPNTGDPATNPTWTFSYDALGNVSKVVDPRGYTLNYLYDPTTKTYPTQVSDSFGYASSSVPDLRFGAVASQTDANGSIENFSYDDFGRLKWVDGPYDVGSSNHTISFAYSEVGVAVAPGVVANNPIPAYSITYHRDAQHPNQPIVTSTFADGLARPIQTKKSHARDTGTGVQVGMVVSGDVTYDGQGRVSKQMQPFFDTQAPAVRVAQPAQSNPAMTNDYDVLDRGTLSRTPLSVNVASPDGYNWATTKTTYGIGQISGSNRLSSTVLDANVSASSAAAPLPGYQRVELHGVRGDVLKVVEQNRLAGSATPTTMTTGYGYNAFSELLSVTDAKGNVTRVTYDTVGRIVTLVSPDAGRTDYQYDLSGNLAAKQTSNLSPGFQLIRYEYDYNRLKKINYPNSADVTYEYGSDTEAGPIGLNRATRIKRETSEAGVKEFEYDALGNVNEETWTLNRVASTNTTARTFAYDYDSFGRLLKVYYPGASAEVVSYGYDAGGNLDTVTGVTKTGIKTNYVQHIGYDEFGARSLITVGNGITTKYTYQPVSRRLTGIDASERDPALVQANKPARPFQQVTYQYDPIGNITQIANAAPIDPTQTGTVRVGPATENFTYDDLYQLKTADGLQQTSTTNRYHYGTSMTYDSINNVVQKSQTSETQTLSGSTVTQTTTRTDQTYTSAYVYPTGGRPHAPSEVNDTVPGSSTPVKRSFVYDKNGNQSSWQRTTGTPLTRTVTYSDDNRATQVTQGGVVLQEALYDGSGQRLVKRANGSAQTAYFGRYVTVRDAVPTTKHIFAGDMRVASKFVPNDANEECASCSDRATVTYFHADQLGSATFASDEVQNLVAHEQYFPSGELWVDQASDTAHTRQPYLFHGKELDVETGLYYFGARYYDPRLGLWTTPDPILDSYLTGTPNRGVFAPQNLNLYSYTWNNPVSHSDQSGLFLDTFVDVAFVALDVLILAKDEATTGGANRAMNVTALVVDVGLVFVPFATGGGAAVRAGGHVLQAEKQATRASVHAVQAQERAAMEAQHAATAAEHGASASEHGAAASEHAGAAKKEPVKPGDEGTYGELVERKRQHGETEPLDMDHQPSFASQVEAKEQQVGRKLTKAEKTHLKNNTPAVASPRKVHQKTSPTYGGRNSKARIKADAANPEAARARDKAAFDAAMKARQK